MIDCQTCAGIIDTYIQSTADDLYKASVSMPQAVHGCLLTCEKCGRSWTLSMHTLDYEGDFIPEGAVLTDVDNAKELTELEMRETLESVEDPMSFDEALALFNESFDKWEKGNDI